MTCPVDQKLETDKESSTAVVVWQRPIATDFFGNFLKVTCAPSSGSFFNIGLSNVMCEAFDSIGSSKTCFFEVNVEGMFGKYPIICVATISPITIY